MPGMKTLKVARGSMRAYRRQNMAAFRNWRNIVKAKEKSAAKGCFRNTPKIKG